MAWAFAVQGIQNRRVYEALQGRVASQIEEAKPVSIASTMWALARVGGWVAGGGFAGLLVGTGMSDRPLGGVTRAKGLVGNCTWEVKSGK